MNEILKIMDNQMLSWVTELDELHRRKADIDKVIYQLEERIAITRKLAEFLKEAQD